MMMIVITTYMMSHHFVDDAFTSTWFAWAAACHDPGSAPWWKWKSETLILQ